MRKADYIRDIIQAEVKKLLRQNTQPITGTKPSAINQTFPGESSGPVTTQTINPSITGVLKQTSGVLEGSADFEDVGAEEAGHIATIPVTILNPVIGQVLGFDSTSTIANITVEGGASFNSDTILTSALGDVLADANGNVLIAG